MQAVDAATTRCYSNPKIQPVKNSILISTSVACLLLLAACTKKITLHEQGKNPEHVQVYTGNYPDTLITGNAYYLIERRTRAGIYSTELRLQVDSPLHDSLLVSARKVIVDTVMQ